jgi:hypothetical protein
MTYLARMPQNWLPGVRREFAQMLEVNPTRPFGKSRGIVHRGIAGNRHEGERSA